MNVAGFVIYSGAPFRDREHWEQYMRSYVPKDLADRTLLIAPFLELWKIQEAKGFVASAEFTSELSEISRYYGQEFEDKLELITDRLLREVAIFLGENPAAPLIPYTASPKRVLDYVTSNNTSFARWLAFQQERPRKSPADWNDYASVGIAEDDLLYAISMRELGQTLQQMISTGKKLTEYAAMCLMESHSLLQKHRYLTLVVALHMAQEDAAS